MDAEKLKRAIEALLEYKNKYETVYASHTEKKKGIKKSLSFTGYGTYIVRDNNNIIYEGLQPYDAVVAYTSLPGQDLITH